MFSSSGEEILVEFITQENRELNLVRRFDVWTIQNGPQRGAVILRFLGFGIVRIVGINLDQARVGDIDVEVSHSGFYTSAWVWVRMTDGARGWAWTSELQGNFYFTSYLAERQCSVPRLGDIWIPRSEVSPNYFVRLYIPGVEDLFQEGDRLLRVEHSGSKSRLIS
jgi:hypothetical protein